jgi:hypothetical protein
MPEGILGDWPDLAAATLGVADPEASAFRLWAIARAQPSLWASIAAHPNAYPRLLQWLGVHGDWRVRVAVATRSSTRSAWVATAQPGGSGGWSGRGGDLALAARPPGRPSGHRWRIGAAGGAVMVTIVAALVLILSHPSGPVVAPGQLGELAANLGGRIASVMTVDEATLNRSFLEAASHCQGQQELLSMAQTYSQFSEDDFGRTAQASVYGIFLTNTSQQARPAFELGMDCFLALSGEDVVQRQAGQARGVAMSVWQRRDDNATAFAVAVYGNVILFRSWFPLADNDPAGIDQVWTWWQTHAIERFKPAVDAAATS